MILAAMAAFGLSNVNAQETAFGVKAGVNFASLTGDNEGLDGLTSFHLGGVANIGVSEKFSVQPEVLYSMQGASYDGGEIKLDYINVPVLAKFMVAEGFSIEAGPQIGFLVSAKEDGEDLKDFVKGTDFSGVLGVGYKLTSGLNFGARYNVGMSNIIDSDLEDAGELKNGVIQLSVGFMF